MSLIPRKKSNMSIGAIAKQPPLAAFKVPQMKSSESLYLYFKNIPYQTIIKGICLTSLIVMIKMIHYQSAGRASSATKSLRPENKTRLDPCYQWRENVPEHNISNTSSFFNCDSEVGECRYFYPARFFDTKCGLGRDHISLVETVKELKTNGTLWPPPNPYVPLPLISMLSVEANGVKGVPFLNENITMIHVHKTGGTSLVTAFASSARKHSFRGIRHMIYNYASRDNQKSLEKINMTSKVLDGAITYPNEWGPDDILVTAIVRDPLDRFVSAVGQAMGGRGSAFRRNGVGNMSSQYRTLCANLTIPETLRCSIDFIHEHSTFWEIHFTPMALELAFGTMFKNIPVALFPIQSVSKYLEELDSPPKKLKNGSQSRPQALQQMNSTHLDQEMIRNVCEIYKVDVIMMRSLGWEVPRCDEYVPKDKE